MNAILDLNMYSITGILTGLVWINIDELSNLPKIVQSYTHINPKDDMDVFETFMIKNNKIGLPYGNKQKLYDLVPNLKIEDRRNNKKFNTVKVSKLALRDYQQEAYNEIMDFIESGGTEFNLAGEPGCGKSFMLSNLLAKLGVKTLIIANQKMLINQLSDEIYKILGERPTLLSAKNTTLGDINVATSQFISQNPDVWYQIKDQISLIALDEAEALASPTVTKIFQRCPAKYKIYISATFSRSVDNRTDALIDFAGAKKIVLVNSALIKPTIIKVHCEEVFYAPINTKQYTKAKINFFSQPSIDDKVIQIVNYSLAKGRQVLIASDISEAQIRLCNSLNDLGIQSRVLSSRTKDKDRIKALEEYAEGTTKCLIGFGVLNAGLSIPKIQTIIRHSTPSSKEKLEQLIGRGRRFFEGKEGIWVIDLYFKGFKNSVRDSLYAYKERLENWKIVSTIWDKFKQSLVT